METQSHSLQVLQLENAQINAERTQLETDLGNVKRQLDDLKEQLSRTTKTHEIEKARLAEEVAEVRREVEVKNAALQSLRLAKNVRPLLNQFASSRRTDSSRRRKCTVTKASIFQENLQRNNFV